jgi:hypothetical protein
MQDPWEELANLLIAGKPPRVIPPPLEISREELISRLKANRSTPDGARHETTLLLNTNDGLDFLLRRRALIQLVEPRQRWEDKSNQHVENPRIDAFIEDVIAVCRTHCLSIGHQDGHGAFLIEDFDESNATWLRNAHDATTTESPPPGILSDIGPSGQLHTKLIRGGNNE